MRHDLVVAFRQIARYPGTTAVAVLSLAIAMSVNAIAFSAVNAFLFKGRAGWEVEGVGRVDIAGVGSSEQGLSAPEFEILARSVAGALEPAAQGRLPLVWQRPGASEPVWSLIVSASYFDIVAARPLAGRLFSRQDGTRPAAVVAERFWRERLDAAPIGQLELTLNGIATPVVGVLADSHQDPGGLYAPQVWIPYEARELWAGRAGRQRHDTDENTLWLSMFGRLEPGISRADADARLHAGAAEIARTWPRTHARRSARYAPLSEWVPELQAIARASVMGMTAVGFVLLIACFNVATLLLARALDRGYEMGLRSALGASRMRLLRQQLTEGLVLSALAGVLAAVVAMWSQRLLSVFAIPIAMPQRLDVTPDARVAAFIALMAVVAGILPAIAPAIRPATQMLSAQWSAGAGGARGRTRHALVILQVAGSTAFLALAALFVQSFLWTRTLNPGFETQRAAVVTLDAGGIEPARATLTLDRIVESLAALPGVTSVAVADRLPMYVGFPRLTAVAKGDSTCASGGCAAVQTYAVGPGFFRTMNAALTSGRELVDGDVHAVVVNETLARQWFGRTEVVGERLVVGVSGEVREIVGVARDMLQRGFTERPAPALYESMTPAAYAGSLSLVVQTAADPAPLVRAITERIYQVDQSVAPESVMTMATRLEMPRWPMRAASLFFATCGVLALVLATAGLAAIMAHGVGRRLREFGLRIAVGARSDQLMTHVLLGSLKIVSVGVGAGLIAGLLLGRALQALLVGVDATDPTTYIGVAIVQAVVALGAALIPARRAGRVDPMIALRSE